MTTSGGGRRGRPPGQSKTGGREKGTPNRDTAALREKLVALGCDPTEELVKIARDPKTETATKVSIFSLLMRHTSPIPKPVADSSQDLDISDESALTMEQVLKLAQYVLERFGPNIAPQRQNSTPETGGQPNPTDKEPPDEH
jgi:hypothetical protein